MDRLFTTFATQAKLDELIRAIEHARGQFIGIEHLTDRQITEIRDALEVEAGAHQPSGKPTAHASLA